MNRPNPSHKKNAHLGIVAIGRNEGERLRRCLDSIRELAARVVYVDSGSTDGSIALAKQFGADVVELDLSIPFTAARARNAGVARLLEAHPDTTLVQFVDGDCELVDGWIDQALEMLRSHKDVAVVCGRRREKFPDASIYNALIDLEWDTPIGETDSCGGDSLVRMEAFQVVGGFKDDLIAGEEPELCYRLRRAGWTVRRIDAEMTLHDAALTRFGQVWKRMIRAGHAAAEGVWLHGWTRPRHNVRRLTSPLFWALTIPLVALALAWPTQGWSGAVLPMVYLLQWCRLCVQSRRRGRAWRIATADAALMIVGKFGELIGVMKFIIGLISRRPSRLIEYKGGLPEPAREVRTDS